jgi:hypothetical protein|tara:strand:+ start:5175 stop:5333 length:159 start_codon:yes stop_codon:yes gene_type:complete
MTGEFINKERTRDGYAVTTELGSKATLAETITKLNEVIRKLEEVTEIFIGEE